MVNATCLAASNNQNRYDAMSGAILGAAQDENRASKRKPFFRMVRVVLASGTIVEVPPFDISHDGIGLILDIDVKRGTKLSMSFPLPLGPDNIVDIEVTGICTHSHLSGKAGGFKTGMQFQEPSSHIAEALKIYMDL
jgi:hypothetical protein